MSPGISSQGLVLATAMVVSTTVIFLTFSSRSKTTSPSDKTLRSCLSSERRKKKNKKKVRFAENVKGTSGNGEEYRKEQREKLTAEKTDGVCRYQMPTNRVALYNGILRDRVHVHKMQCS